ncbi:aldehyde dehydrogenase family protein [Haloarcula sp. H-GB4]|nr:aldehyde dehydrogenase family protein [Haloarcula sp. H-GB4]MDQ2074352.1 aldehyde dehydrogenase family protein [Haloarcula sp. H-GB4]
MIEIAKSLGSHLRRFLTLIARPAHRSPLTTDNACTSVILSVKPSACYVELAVFTDVESDMRIAREEIFGPVQTVQSFKTYDEAIALANDTQFGLAGGVATESTDIAHQAATDIDAGVVYINAYGPIRPEGPYGGFKQSGIGHDLGRAAVEQYQQPKTVYVNLDSPEI